MPPSENTAPEFFTSFQPHIDRLDLSGEVFTRLTEQEPQTDEEMANCQAAADDLTKQILGMKDKRSFDYWKHDDFKSTSKKHPRGYLDPLEIELKVLKDAGRDNWVGESDYGRAFYKHGLTAIKLMFPNTDITPSFADIAQLSMALFHYNRKYLHLIGSMDASKSSSAARLSFLYTLIDPAYSFTTVANPLLDSADSTIFGDLSELFDEFSEAHPLPQIKNTDNSAPKYFPHARVDASGRISFFANARSKGGWMRLRSLKKSGVLIGSKGLGKDKRRGVGLTIIDEINRVDRFEAKKDLSNVSKQNYFQFISTQNPKDPSDFGGQMSRPKPWGDWGPSDVADIGVQDIIWPTEYSGIAYRIARDESPNIRAAKVIYPYLLHQGKVDQTANDYGEDSPEYRSQILALFSTEGSAPTVISRAKVESSLYDSQAYSFTEEQGRVLFCDPAFSTDGDRAIAQVARFGKGVVRLVDGTQIESPLIEVLSNANTLQIVSGATWNEQSKLWQDMVRLGRDPSVMSYGKTISPDEQIAIKMMFLSKLYEVPTRNIGYDFSMRAELTPAINNIIAGDCVPFQYNRACVGYELQTEPGNTEDTCKSRLHELHRITADVLLSRQLRGPRGKIGIALDQLSERRLCLNKTKYEIENKEDFKTRNRNKSPDHADCLVGLVGMCFDRGFRSSSSMLFRKQDTTDLTATLNRVIRKKGPAVAKLRY